MAAYLERVPRANDGLTRRLDAERTPTRGTSKARRFGRTVSGVVKLLV